jgi:hypothetical protein
MKKERIAIFVDLANMEDFDLRCILEQARQSGRVEEAQCYGDFRQLHIGDMALDLYALGFMMVHCPSWNNGDSVMKRSDDRILEKTIRNTLNHRPQISTYILVTSDADIIPTCHTIIEHEKRLILYSNPAGLGGLLRSCGFEVRQVPKKSGYQQASHQLPDFCISEVTGKAKPETDNGDLSIEKILLEIDQMEKGSRYLTFMATVGRIASGNAVIKQKIQQQVSGLIKDGVIESYKHQIPAIRLNREHPLVTSALNISTTKEEAGEDKVLVMSGAF